MKKKITIDLYTYTYNDEDILPFFLKYYSFVDRMTFIDSGSTDNTRKILDDYAAKGYPYIRLIQTGLTWWDHVTLHNLRNEVWRGSKYDYIFFPDCDEIFYYPDIKEYIRHTENDIYEMQGFEMIAKEFPAPGSSILKVHNGVPFQVYNKSTIFKPTIDIEFLNAHIRYSRSTNVNIGNIKLLHYRSLGLSMMLKRAKRERDRLPVDCKYRTATDNQAKERFNRLMSQAKKVI